MNATLTTLFTNFTKNAPAAPDVIQNLQTSTRVDFPSDYLEALQYMNGGEGFIGKEYFRLYPADKIVLLNQIYGTQEFTPGLLIFGSNGGGEAFAFNSQISPIHIVQIPFIPMKMLYANEFGNALLDCLSHLRSASAADPPAEPHLPNPSLIGKEIHEILPVVFGGSPTDLKNKVPLSPEEYAPYVVWWNQYYREMKTEDTL